MRFSSSPMVLPSRSEEHTSELQSRVDLVCRLLLEKKKEYVEMIAVYELDYKLRYQIAPNCGLISSKERLCFCGHELYLFFFNDTATTEIYTLSLHDALPI